MVEPPKETCSSLNPKEKTSFMPDEQIGKDFLTSWKSMSVTEDDAMDFQFETVSKGKKKAFNFEKMDMDFSLDADFGKLSSFKVDMPDLDFSRASKNIGKSTEISGGSKCGKHDERNDLLSFSFDFNDFNFDSSPVKESKSKISENKEITLDKSVNQDSGNQPSDDITDIGNSIPYPSNSETIPNQVLSGGDKILDEITKTSVAEESDLNETVSTEPIVKQTSRSLPVQSAFTNIPNQPTISKLSTQICLPDKTEEIINSGIEDAINGNDPEPNFEKSLLKKSPLPPLTRPIKSCFRDDNRTSNDHVSLGTNGTKSIENDLDVEVTSASISVGILHEKADQECNNSTSMFASSSLSSDRKLRQQTLGVVHSRFFKKLEEKESIDHHITPNSANIFPQVKPLIGTMPLNPPEPQRNEIKSDVAKLGTKVNARSNGRDLTKGEPTLMRIEKNTKDLASIGSKISGSGLTKQTTSDSAQECINSEVAVSSMDNVQDSITKNAQSSSFKDPNKLTNLSSLKIPRVVSSNSTCEKPHTSLHIQEAGKKVSGSVVPNLSWKRKTFEDSNVNKVALNPPKRLPGTVNDSRKTISSSEILSDKQVCSDSIMVGNKNSESVCPKFPWDSRMEASVKELELTSAMVENDGHVEIAEGYAKGLDDICNMLKKKHEEAKELMVRALVTNNKLLMLNHPIYDVKLQMIEKEAAKLISKHAIN